MGSVLAFSHPPEFHFDYPLLSCSNVRIIGYALDAEPRKSTMKVAAPWLSNTADANRISNQPPPKYFLDKRLVKLSSRQMETAAKTPISAQSRRAAEHSSFQDLCLQRFSFPQPPLSLNLRSGHRLSHCPLPVSLSFTPKQIPNRLLRCNFIDARADAAEKRKAVTIHRRRSRSINPTRILPR